MTPDSPDREAMNRSLTGQLTHYRGLNMLEVGQRVMKHIEEWHTYRQAAAEEAKRRQKEKRLHFKRVRHG